MTAREEERKRLRRDLHDGVGPSLAAILLKLQAAQSRRDDAERDAMLDRDPRGDQEQPSRRCAGSSTTCARRRSTRSAWSARSASAPRRCRPTPWSSRSHGPDQLPPLPAAVEVAAFRIASEAMTNVAKHSGATRCRVDARAGRDARAHRVRQRPRQLPGPTGPGVGWTSMTERAAELGGSCTISSRREGGLVVRAVLPLTQHGSVPALKVAP